SATGPGRQQWTARRYRLWRLAERGLLARSPYHDRPSGDRVGGDSRWRLERTDHGPVPHWSQRPPPAPDRKADKPVRRWSRRRACDRHSHQREEEPSMSEFIPPAKPIIGDEEREAVDRVMRSGMIAQGPEVAAFEQEFAEHFGLG